MATQPHDVRRRRLSVAMIVRDEQDVLSASIENVQPIADDIFILDTGSTDQTAGIAEKMGAKVSTVPWNDDFSEARNLLLQEIPGDWILWLDAGERLTEESVSQLRKFIDSEADPQKAYMLMVVIPSAGGGASDEQTARPRLIPHCPDLRFQGRVRETLDPSMAAAGLQVDMAPGRIMRHSRENDLKRKADKARRDLKLIALEKDGKNDLPPRLLLALGDAYSNLGDMAKARQAYQQVVNLADRGSTEMLEGYYGLLTTFDGDESLRDRQLSIALEALEIYPLDAQLLCAMGSYLQRQNRLDLASRAFETAVKFGQVDLETWHLSEIAEMAIACLNLTLQLEGKDEDARRVLEEAVGRYPESNRLRRHLIDLLVKKGQPDEAVRVADAMYQDADGRKALRDAVRGASSATSQDWVHALGYLQSAYTAGCRDPFCLRWLVVTLICNGQTEAVQPVLDEWLQLEPNNVEANTYLKVLQPAEQVEGAADAAGADAVEGKSPEKPDGSRQIRIDPAGREHGPMPFQVSTFDVTSSADTTADSGG